MAVKMDKKKDSLIYRVTPVIYQENRAQGGRENINYAGGKQKGEVLAFGERTKASAYFNRRQLTNNLSPLDYPRM